MTILSVIFQSAINAPKILPITKVQEYFGIKKM